MGSRAGVRDWEYQHGNVRIIPSKDIEQAISKWEDIPMLSKVKLRIGIDRAPVMVREAITCLKNHLAYEKPTTNFDQWLKTQSMPENPDDSNAGQALVKYFHLRYRDKEGSMSDTYWRYVRGIILVYEKILSGLSAPYDLVIANMDAVGGVVIKGTNPKPVSPIRQVFGFADEWGHVPWDNGSGRPGRIRLSYYYITKTTTNWHDISRTLIHEGSHKWARTKDILYKSESLAKVYNKDVAERAEARRLGQEVIQLPGRVKPFRPMTGVDKQLALIPEERYLENADSYAWAARRMWKHLGHPDA